MTPKTQKAGLETKISIDESWSANVEECILEYNAIMDDPQPFENKSYSRIISPDAAKQGWMCGVGAH